MNVEKEDFLKKYREQEKRAYLMCKALKSSRKSKKINYVLKKEITIINGVVEVKMLIQEFPIQRITHNFEDVEKEYYEILDITNIED